MTDGESASLRFAGQSSHRKWTVVFEDTSVECEGPPWSAVSTGTIHVPNLISLRKGTQRNARAASGSLPPPSEDEDPRFTFSRFMTWGVIKLAESKETSEDALFRASFEEDSITLRPERRSSIPLQWVYHGDRRVLPNVMGDIPCSDLDVDRLLAMLNSTLDTTFSVDEPYMRTCLEYFLSSSRDFGEIYGRLRPRWPNDFSQLLSRIDSDRMGDDAFRYDAMHPKGSYIRNSHVPPRRVWDLYSNRVLPYHVLPHAHPGHIPGNIWTVSHSWVDEAARDLVWTPINGHEWPVPIPRETTLEHIRVELLNLGAEYVWLDVLCLRQQGRDEHEDLRKHEWRLDVPTIGHIYSDPTRCCVTYFNGLGLPFDPSPSVVLSARHWISRVWTVQEGTPAWLPGGLTGAASAAAQAFFQVNLPRAILARDQKRDMAVRSFAFALRTLRARHCSTELDRIAGLAYVLGCRTLPVYDEATSADAAWAALLMHLPPYKRTLVAVEHVVQQPDSAALFPSWAQVLDMGVGYTLRSLRPALILRLVDQASLSSDQPALYFHQVFSPGPCRITDPGSGQLRVQSLFRKTWFSLQGSTVGAISENVTYTLLSLSRTVWMIVDVLRVGELNGTPVLEVIKRGSMFLYDEPPREMTDTWVDVLYLSNDDASTTSTTASTTSSPREAGAPGVVTRLIQYAYGA